MRLNEAGILTPSHYKKMQGKITHENLLGSGKWQTLSPLYPTTAEGNVSLNLNNDAVFVPFILNNAIGRCV